MVNEKPKKVVKKSAGRAESTSKKTTAKRKSAVTKKETTVQKKKSSVKKATTPKEKKPVAKKVTIKPAEKSKAKVSAVKKTTTAKAKRPTVSRVIKRIVFLYRAFISTFAPQKTIFYNLTFTNTTFSYLFGQI